MLVGALREDRAEEEMNLDDRHVDVHRLELPGEHPVLVPGITKKTILILYGFLS